MSLGNQAAYPYNHAVLNDSGRVADGKEYGSAETGMTIRQRYAMAAMQGCVTNGWLVPSIIVEQAFDVADAMLQYEELECEANRQEGKQTYTEESEAETKKDIR